MSLTWIADCGIYLLFLADPGLPSRYISPPKGFLMFITRRRLNEVIDNYEDLLEERDRQLHASHQSEARTAKNLRMALEDLAHVQKHRVSLRDQVQRQQQEIENLRHALDARPA